MKMSAQMSEDNIFLRAALKGEFTQPCNSGSSKKKEKKKQPEKKVFHRYSQMEDLLIQAVKKCGREWRGVVTFMKKHAEVLTENSEIYKCRSERQKAARETTKKGC